MASMTSAASNRPRPMPPASLTDIDRPEAEVGGGLDGVAREGAVLVPAGGVRSYRVRSKLAREVLDRALVFGEVELARHETASPWWG